MQQSPILQVLLLLPIFLAVESVRAVLWAGRAVDEPDKDGPLLRALLALLIGSLAVVPGPVWTLVMYVACIAWVPVRGVLWVWIGRGSLTKKRSPRAVTRWYEKRRARRAETLRRQQ